MSAARPSLEILLRNLPPAIDRARRKLAEVRTRAEILEVRECAVAALDAAQRLDDAATPHGTLSDALGQLLAGATEIITLADARLRADANIAPVEGDGAPRPVIECGKEEPSRSGARRWYR
jgi:hypothetical protein